MQCKKDFFRIREIYPNLPVLCLTQHFTGPQIKNLKVLWLGEPMPNFFTNPETAHTSKETQNISTCLFSVSPSTFNRTQNKKSESALARGTYAQFFHKYGNGDLDLGTTSCFEANDESKKNTHTKKQY